MAKSKAEKKLYHYMTKAISDYKMIQKGDRVMVCLSGGKDSFTMLQLLHQLRIHQRNNFELFVFTLDQSQPGWDDSNLRQWLEQRGYPYEILKRNTYAVVMDKISEGKTYCSLCSRLRRGNIYTYAETHGYNKVALGHHRDDMIESLLMSVLYSGAIKSMPPKLLSDNKRSIVIRPLAYCQEADIKEYAAEQQFPIIPCNLCGSQENMTRVRVKQLIKDLADANPKVPANILNALGNIQPSQLMDQKLWDFRNLENDLERESIAQVAND
ncbi:MAG: tRNA 2-thiocytidine(32) synthetase TtcA [Gammaproteobacteria bacterium]|nr:tRNA 2-thiocytidine(32) synthetase TtcA [Gammaproteobacteria bacterium]